MSPPLSFGSRTGNRRSGVIGAMTTAATQRVLRLTPRWRPLRYHREQSRLWYSLARFKTIRAGRRGGKTELAKRKLVKSLRDCLQNPDRPWDDPRFFAGAPVRDQAKKIFWNDLKSLVPRSWVSRVYDGDLCIRTRWNAELWVVGLDVPARIEGPGWDGGVIDEFANCRAGIFDMHLRPALSDRNGWLWLLGVPDFAGPSQAEYERFCEIGETRSDPEWDDFVWSSADILDKKEVDSMRRRMDPRLFEQELMGRFVMAGGRAFPDFQVRTHAGKPVPYDPALPIGWSLDFNCSEGNPMCMGVIQHHMGEVRVIDEFVLDQIHTEVACTAFLERAEQRGWNLENMGVYGDSSGNQHHTSSSTTDWHIVRNRLRNVKGLRMRVPMGNPELKDTMNAVNAKLKNAEGKVSLFIDPHCTRIIEDLKTAIWPSDLSEQHALAWLRYFVNREYPIVPVKTARNIGRVVTVN